MVEGAIAYTESKWRKRSVTGWLANEILGIFRENHFDKMLCLLRLKDEYEAQIHKYVERKVQI